MSLDGHVNAQGEPLLRPGAGALARAFSRQLPLLWTGVVLLIALGWTYLFFMLLDGLSRLAPSDLGPGMGLFTQLKSLVVLDGFAAELVRTLCRPWSADSGAGVLSLGGIALVLAMWMAMTLAMMVPTASPMIATYADISITARDKAIKVVPVPVLIAGYLAAWLLFCFATTAAQWALLELDLMSPELTLASPRLAGAIMIAAGIYQFTPLKMACLNKCRTPLPFFMSNWTDSTTGVFRLGFRQGLFCLSCCWALMLVMFAVGLMNVIWMAALGVVMALEKTLRNPVLIVRGTGAALIAAGLVLAVTP